MNDARLLRKDYSQDDKECLRLFEEELARKSPHMRLVFPCLNFPYYK